MSTTRTGDETWINRVNALLAKAESTDFEEEAEALMAKAQELMARHAIDDAMLASAGDQPSSGVITETIVVEAPYATAKAMLLGAVAHANRCRCVMGSAGAGRQVCVVLGHEADVVNVRTLFAALSLHATRAMLSATVPRGDTPRRFRHAFLLAFASRIGQRLVAARRRAELEAEEASRRSGGAGVAVVLAGRDDAVDAAFRTAYPRVRTARTTSSSAAGRFSGRAAADRAEIDRPVSGGGGPRLSAG